MRAKLDKKCELTKNANLILPIPIEKGSAELLEIPETSKALKILEKSAYTEAELNAYEYYWDAVYNERGAIRHGYKQGMAQGIAQGMEKGMAQANRENVQKMKADGTPTDLIAKYTGLSTEEIEIL